MTAAVEWLRSASGSSTRRGEADPVRQLAREIYLERKRRMRYFDDDLFGEPSWDILLDLYVASCDGRRVPTTSACIGSNVPPTTALRWLRILESRGFVDRQSDDADGRRTFVSLSAKGIAVMEEYLESTRFRMLLDLGTFAEAETASSAFRFAAE